MAEGQINFYCSCGFSTGDIPGESTDEFFRRIENHDKNGGCCNCGGRKCMGCVFREYDHDCKDDCPECCEEISEVTP